MARPKATNEIKSFHKSIRLKPSTVEELNTYGEQNHIKGLSRVIVYILEKEVNTNVKESI